MSFIVNGFQDTQIIVAVEDDTEYQVSVDDAVIENYETNLSGKIVISLELELGCKEGSDLQEIMNSLI